MKSNYSVKVVLRRDKKLVNGNCPLYMQIIIDSSHKRISLGESIDPKYWDKKNGLAIGKGFSILNTKLNKKKSDLETFCNQSIIGGLPITFSLIEDYLKGNVNRDFYKVFDNMLSIKTPYLNEDTIYQYNTLKIRLKDFKPKLFISDIDLNFITKFDGYLKKLKIGLGGEYNHHKCLKCIINTAINHKKMVDNPYKLFKIVTLKHKTTFLDESEVVLLKTYRGENKVVRDMFLLACYTGLRYGDLFSLKVSDIDTKNQIISKEMLKTKHDIDVPLCKQALGLVVQYMIKKNPNGKLFPEISNQIGNRALKEIAEKCEIDKNISFHVGRHTFASFLVNDNNVSLPLVSKLLGHKKIATTMIYTNSNINNLKNVMNNFRYG